MTTDATPPSPRFDHVGLAVHDLEAMTAWYAEALGLHVALRFELSGPGLSIAMLANERGQRFELLHHHDGRSGAVFANPVEAAKSEGYGHACFVVADLPGTHARILALGAREVFPPGPSPEAGVDMSWVHDPEGNLLELITPPPAALA